MGLLSIKSYKFCLLWNSIIDLSKKYVKCEKCFKKYKFCDVYILHVISCSRIYELLPPKIQQWQSSPCVTEENNNKMLEKIRREQLECRQKLAQLDLKHQELDGVIERAKNVSIAPEQDVRQLGGISWIWILRLTFRVNVL